MKMFIFCLVALLLCSFTAQAVDPIKITLPMILAFIVGVWEVVIRLVPTIGQWGVIGKVIEVLAWLSNFLNNKKK